MARRGTLWGSLGEINSRDQELKEGLSADGVLYFSPSDDATLLPDFYGTGLGLQPWPMVPAGFGTYVALFPDVLMGASWAAPDLVAQGQDAGVPMPQGAEGPAMTIQGTPNDARYTDGSLWGMYGDASSPGNEFGSQAAEAWAQGHTGSMANVIGVIDTGIDYTHPDLYLNIWLNQREIPTTLRASLSDIDLDGLITFRDLNGSANATYVLDYNSDGRIDAGDLLNDTRWENGVDEDGNGYLDDLIGWDFANNDNDPMDVIGHGTHVAGTIGALGGNGIGVVGVNWNVQLVPLQIFSATDASAGGTAAVNYFTTAAISARAAGSAENFIATNNSWGGGWYEQTLLDAITAAARQDILFVASAGNESSNNDERPSYPDGFSTAPTTGYEAVISVAAITSTGSLSEFSNFGANSVDIAAPGSDIWSLLPSGEYRSASGTSMAAPHVTGAIALYASLFPHATGAQIREALLSSATFTASLNDLVASDGRLNIPAMLAIAPPVTEFADWLDGTAGGDSLNGRNGNDTISAGMGSDTLNGGNGGDILFGGDGDDSLFGDAGADTLSGGEGNDALAGGYAADSLFGDTGADTMLGGDDNDSLNGGAGDESLLGEGGNDSLLGDTGADTLSGGEGNDALNAGNGTDSLIGDAGADMLLGGDDNDTMNGGNGGDILFGDGGDDWLMGGTGSLSSIFLAAQQNPFSSISLDIYAKPAFADLDDDGDLDLVVGRDDGTLSSFRRNADGSFTPMNGIGGNSENPFSGIDVGALSAPTFSDFDRNGTLDLVIGRGDGTLAAFRRNADGGFTPMDGAGGNPANPFGNIDVGFQSTPCFNDIDLDGDQDLVLGNSGGTLSSFRRNDDGTYTLMDGLNGRPTNPFSSVYAGVSSMPTFADLDFDGDADLVIGRYDGNLLAFRRNADGSFSPMDGNNGNPANPFAGLFMGYYNAPVFTDVNGDAVPDLVVGAQTGVLRLFMQTITNTNADSLVGGNGADTLDGGDGNDSLVGGAGNDLFIISDTFDRIIETANGGADTIITSVSMTMPNHVEALRTATDVSGVTLTGGAGNDMLIGNGLSNTFNGGAGDDVILAGNVTLADIYALFAT